MEDLLKKDAKPKRAPGDGAKTGSKPKRQTEEEDEGEEDEEDEGEEDDGDVEEDDAEETKPRKGAPKASIR